jgi:glycosidase
MTASTDILAQDTLYQRPEELVVFAGNHDQPRFLTVAGGDLSKLLMAEALVLTTRRVPHLYYGDEIAMGAGTDRIDRSIRADFPGGFPGDPVNAFLPEGRAGDAATVFKLDARLTTFLRFQSFSQGQPAAAVTQGKLVIQDPKENSIYWRQRPLGDSCEVLRIYPIG